MTGKENYRGSHIGTGSVGEPAVTSVDLRVRASGLSDIEFSRYEQTSQRYERRYQEMERTNYRTETPNGTWIWTGLAIGGGFALVGLPFYLDEDAHEEDREFAEIFIWSGVGMAVLFTLFGFIDSNTRRHSDTKRVGTISEPYQETGNRTVKHTNERVEVRVGSQRIKTAHTDWNGKISLTEDDLLAAPIHPMDLVGRSSIDLTFVLSGNQRLNSSV